MLTSEFIADIEGSLHPEPYSERTSPRSDVLLSLLRCKKYRAHYALTVTQWDDGQDGTALLGTIRAEIRRVMDASWPVNPVGLYLIVCGSEILWSNHIREMPADKTGLHALIVQAVHFVDTNTGATFLNQSNWGPIRFGGVNSISTVVDDILSKHNIAEAGL